MQSRTSVSKKLIIVGIIFAVIILVPIVIAAVYRNRPPSDPATALAFRSMTSDLRGLAMMQATTKRLIGRYAPEPDQTGHASSPGVNRPVITLSDTGWAAIVTHKQLPGVRCGIGVFTRNPVRRFAKSGEIVCE